MKCYLPHGYGRHIDDQIFMCSYVNTLQLGETIKLALDNGLRVEVMCVTFRKKLRSNEQPSFTDDKGRSKYRDIAKDDETLRPCVTMWSRALCHLQAESYVLCMRNIFIFKLILKIRD